MSAGTGGRTKEVKADVGDCASVAGEIDTCSVQDREADFRFRDDDAVAEDDFVVVAGDAVSVAEKEARKTTVRGELEDIEEQRAE